VIFNKEYSVIEGCSQTVPVWLFGMEQVQPGLAFVEADIQPIVKNTISFRLAIDESSLESYLAKETLFVY
jgi:hypothetical protein